MIVIGSWSEHQVRRSGVRAVIEGWGWGLEADYLLGLGNLRERHRHAHACHGLRVRVRVCVVVVVVAMGGGLRGLEAGFFLSNLGEHHRHAHAHHCVWWWWEGGGLSLVSCLGEGVHVVVVACGSVGGVITNDDVAFE